MRRRRGSTALGAGVALVALLLSGCGREEATSASPDVPSSSDAGPSTWSAEFDEPAGRPDPAVWTAETGNLESEGWGNDELQFYVDQADTAGTDGEGHLVISARPAPADRSLPCWPDGADCPWVSARLTTAGRVAFGEGRLEVRAKLPTGTGLLPAIWMMGESSRTWPANGEIDIAEVVGSEPDTLYGTVHGPGYSSEEGVGGSTPLGAAASEGFRTYGVERDGDRIDWLLDGDVYLTVVRDDVPAEQEWVFDQPFHLLLNVAVGGDWPGDPDEATPDPSQLVVDWVRFEGVMGRADSALSAE